MNINYHGKNITVTEDLKNLAEKKLSKLDKYFTEDISAKVIFEVNKKNQKIVEVTVFLPKDIIRSEVNEESFEDAIDRAIEILSRQVRKYKTKLKIDTFQMIQLGLKTLKRLMKSMNLRKKLER